MSKSASSTGGFGIGFVLFIVFLILKLTHTIDWSWWWVTCPLWAPLAILLLVLGAIGAMTAIIILFVGVAAFVTTLFDRIKA